MRISRRKLSLVSLVSSILIIASAYAAANIGRSSTPVSVGNPISLTRVAVGTDLSYSHSSSGTICTATNATFWSCPSQTIFPGDNVTLQQDISATQPKAITPNLVVTTPGVSSADYTITFVVQQLTAVCSSSSCAGTATGPTFTSIQPVNSAKSFWVIFVSINFSQSATAPLTFTLTTALQR